jgi:hypothetical protein
VAVAAPVDSQVLQRAATLVAFAVASEPLSAVADALPVESHWVQRPAKTVEPAVARD